MATDLQLKFEQAWQDQISKMALPGDLALITLRAHAICEVALKDLLAVRLDVPPERLPDLNFERLARLSLAGLRHELLDITLDFNRIRNYVAHHIHASELDVKIGEFVRKNDLFNASWPPADRSRPKLWSQLTNSIAIAAHSIAEALADYKREYGAGNRKDAPGLESYTLLVLSAFTAASLRLDRIDAMERGEDWLGA